MLFRAVSNTALQLQEFGPLIHGHVSLPNALANGLRRLGEEVPPAAEGALLIDTGATHDCIDLGIAQALRMKQTGVGRLYRANSSEEAPIYNVHWAIDLDPCSAMSLYEMESYVYAIKGLGAFNAKHNLSIIGLLGREFLRKGQLTYNGVAGTAEFRLAQSPLNMAGRLTCPPSLDGC